MKKNIWFWAFMLVSFVFIAKEYSNKDNIPIDSVTELIAVEKVN